VAEYRENYPVITIRLPVERFEKLRQRIIKVKPNDIPEVKKIGASFREVRTSLTREQADKMCKDLGPVIIKEI
jgi:hypothetical protein